MQFRNLGPSGLRVSVVGLGCNNFGGRIDDAAAKAVIHKAFDVGITLLMAENARSGFVWRTLERDADLRRAFEKAGSA